VVTMPGVIFIGYVHFLKIMGLMDEETLFTERTT
jgi:hypothetical protein